MIKEEEMREEIAAAVVFLKRLILKEESTPKEKAEEFSNSLSALLVEKFRNHWYKDKPAKGQGYRCIRIHPEEPLDPLLERAASSCGIQQKAFHIPMELTLWVDPEEVCCRVGDVFSHFCTVATFKDGTADNQAHTIDVDELWERAQQQISQQFLSIRSGDLILSDPPPLFLPQPTHWSPVSLSNSNSHHSNLSPPPLFVPPFSPGGSPYPPTYMKSFLPTQGSWLYDSHWQPSGSISPPGKSKSLRENAASRGVFLSRGGNKGRGLFSSQGDRYHWVQDASKSSALSSSSSSSSGSISSSQEC